MDILAAAAAKNSSCIHHSPMKEGGVAKVKLCSQSNPIQSNPRKERYIDAPCRPHFAFTVRAERAMHSAISTVAERASE